MHLTVIIEAQSIQVYDKGDLCYVALMYNIRLDFHLNARVSALNT